MAYVLQSRISDPEAQKGLSSLSSLWSARLAHPMGPLPRVRFRPEEIAKAG